MHIFCATEMHLVQCVKISDHVPVDVREKVIQTYCTRFTQSADRCTKLYLATANLRSAQNHKNIMSKRTRMQKLSCFRTS